MRRIDSGRNGKDSSIPRLKATHHTATFRQTSTQCLFENRIHRFSSVAWRLPAAHQTVSKRSLSRLTGKDIVPKSIRAVQNLPSVRKLIKQIAAQFLARGPMNGNRRTGIDGDGKQIPGRSLRKERWFSELPVGLLSPFGRRQLNNQLAQTYGENVHMKALRTIEWRCRVGSLEDAVIVKSPCKPNVRAWRKGKIVPK